MRCKRIFALVCLTACLTACGNSIANEQNDGVNYWDADGNTITFRQGYETAVEESEVDTVIENQPQNQETEVQTSITTETYSSITEIVTKEYLRVSDLKTNKEVSTQDLICFNGVVYGRSFKLIDYVGGSEPVGTISSLISSDLVPQLDGETNQEYLLNISIYEATSYSVIVNCNGIYVLFESIDVEQDYQ